MKEDVDCAEGKNVITLDQDKEEEVEMKRIEEVEREALQIIFVSTRFHAKD